MLSSTGSFLINNETNTGFLWVLHPLHSEPYNSNLRFPNISIYCSAPKYFSSGWSPLLQYFFSLPTLLKFLVFIPVPCPHCSHHPYQPPMSFPSVLVRVSKWCVWFAALGSDCQAHEFIWIEQPVEETHIRADLSLPCVCVSGGGGGRCHQVLCSLHGSCFLLKVHKQYLCFKSSRK